MTEFSVREDFIVFSPPTLGDEECAAVEKVLRSGWLSTGPETVAFESEFSKKVGAESALAVNSCTAALHLALLAHGVGPGDEVLTTPMTFAATVNVIEHVGATPVFVDVHPETLLMDPSKIAGCITKKSKVILPVHFAGQPCDMASINATAEEYGLAVIEDAAHALPTKYADGSLVGSSSNLCTFSFYANKNMTTGEGGMLTGPKALVDSVRTIALHGLNRDAWKRFGNSGFSLYDVESPGYKYNMTDIQASLGRVQMARLDEFWRRRVDMDQRYRNGLKDVPAVTVLSNPAGEHHGYHLFIVFLDPAALNIDRDQFMSEMKALQVGVALHYPPVNEFSYYRDKYGPSTTPVASRLFPQMMSLPFSPKVSDQQVDYIVDAIKYLCQKHKA